MKQLAVLLIGIGLGLLLGLCLGADAEPARPPVVFVTENTAPVPSFDATTLPARTELQASQRTPVVLDTPAAAEPPRITAADAWQVLEASVRDLRDTCDGTLASAAAKYAGMNPAQLKLALKQLEPRYKSEMNRLLDEQLRSAPFEDVVPGSPVVSHAGSFKFEQTLEGGELRMRSATLSADQYPDYHRLEVEYAWLRGELHKSGW